MIDVRIDELVLHGFDPRHRHAIGDALHDALVRLINERGVAALQSIDIVHLDGGSFELASNARANGENIARNVHGALGGKRV